MNALDNIILITGTARSGTSMTAGIVSLCGAFGGKMRETKSKRIVFENEDICKHVIRPYLKSIGADPKGQKPLPKLKDLIPIPNLRERVEEFLYRQRYEGQQVFYKDPKLALMWPLWHKAFPKARWVLVRRKDEDIIYSCMRTGFMLGYKTKRGWQSWINVYKRRFERMRDQGLFIREVWPTKFIEGDFGEIQACIKWLGLKWEDQAVRDFIRPELFYNGGKDGE